MTQEIKFLLVACSLPLLIVLISKRIDANRRKSLRNQTGTTAIHGNAANSLQTEKMRIRKVNRDKGVIGELGVAKDLDYLASEYGLAVIHDLSIPGSKANIDHILITRKVVFVIDAKNYKGLVKVTPNAAGKKILRVGGRDQSILVAKVKKYSESVSAYLEAEGIPIKVIPLLAFYKATFHEDSAVSVDGVTVNIFGIENELMRYANSKTQEFNTSLLSTLLLKGFPLKGN